MQIPGMQSRGRETCTVKRMFMQQAARIGAYCASTQSTRGAESQIQGCFLSKHLRTKHNRCTYPQQIHSYTSAVLREEKSMTPTVMFGLMTIMAKWTGLTLCHHGPPTPQQMVYIISTSMLPGHGRVSPQH